MSTHSTVRLEFKRKCICAYTSLKNVERSKIHHHHNNHVDLTLKHHVARHDGRENLLKTMALYKKQLSKAAASTTTRRNREKIITCVSFLNDYDHCSLCIGKENGMIEEWRPPTMARLRYINVENTEKTIAKWKQNQILRGHKGNITCMTWIIRTNVDDVIQLLLASGSADGAIRIWAPYRNETTHNDKACIQAMTTHSGTITQLKSVKNILISSSTDGKLSVWKSCQNRDKILLYPFYVIAQTINLSSNKWITSLCIDSDAITTVYTGDSSGELNSYRLNNGETKINAMNQSVAHKLAICDINLIPPSNIIVLSWDGMARVHDPNSNSIIFQVENPNETRYVSSYACSNGYEIYLLDYKGYIHVWNIRTEICEKMIRLTNAPCLSMNVANDGTQLYVHSEVATIEWFIEREKCVERFVGHEAAVVGVATIQQTLEENQLKYNRLISSSIDGVIRCWNLNDMLCQNVLKDRKIDSKNAITCLCVCPNSIFIITGHKNGHIRIWNTDSGTSTVAHSKHDTITDITFMQANDVYAHDHVITSHENGTAIVWEIVDYYGQCIGANWIVRTVSSELLCVASSPMQQIFATGGNINIIELWDLKTNSCTKLSGDFESVISMVFDANFLIVGCQDGSLHIWDIVNYYRVAYTNTIHTGAILSMILLEDYGGYVVTCSVDGYVCVYDYIHRRILKRFELGNGEDPLCIAWNPIDCDIIIGTEQHDIIMVQFNDNASPPKQVSLIDMNLDTMQEKLVELQQQQVQFD